MDSVQGMPVEPTSMPSPAHRAKIHVYTKFVHDMCTRGMAHKCISFLLLFFLSPSRARCLAHTRARSHLCMRAKENECAGAARPCGFKTPCRTYQRIVGVWHACRERDRQKTKERSKQKTKGAMRGSERVKMAHSQESDVATHRDKRSAKQIKSTAGNERVWQRPRQKDSETDRKGARLIEWERDR